MRLFRKLYRKLFCRVELEYNQKGFYTWRFYSRFLLWKKLIDLSSNTKDLANAIEEWKNGK